MADVMMDFVENAVKTSYEDLSADAVEYAKRATLDTLGCAIAGSTADGCKAAVDLG